MGRLVQRHPNLIEQLLAGDQPRCFWSPARTTENAAFARLHSANAQLPAAARLVFQTADQNCIDLEGLRWTFTRIVAENADGVLVCGVAFKNVPDPRLAAIPSILDFAAGRMPNAANLHRLMEHVLAADSRLFTHALLFASQNNHAFVLLHDTSGDVREGRTWQRWPLERLFIKRRASLISNPLSQERGLAIPFAVPPSERYVVIAALRDIPILPADRDFLAALECVTAAVPQATPTRRSPAQDRIDAGSAPPTPRIVLYVRPVLESQVARLIEMRGWNLRVAASTPEMIESIQDHCDILLLDAGRLHHPLQTLRSVRRTAPHLPILYFAGEECDELDILADRRLPSDADDHDTFTAIKALVRDLPRRRREFLEWTVNRAAGALTKMRSPRELSRAIAEDARRLFGDWVAVHLLDGHADVYTTELPSRPHPLLPEVPNTFLSGFAVMKSRADETLFAAISDDPQTRQALADLRPVSGATVPLLQEGSINGTLVVLSTKRELGEPEFEGILQYADAASHAFALIQARSRRRELGSSHAWTRVSAGDYDIHVYHPRGRGAGIFRATPIDANSVAIETSVPGRAQLRATLDIGQGTLSYSADGYPVPVQCPAFGPAPVMQQAAEQIVERTILLKAPSVTLIYDPELPRIIDSGCMVDVLQNAMRSAAENPALDLAQFIDERGVGFIAITSRLIGAAPANYRAPS